MCSVSPSVGHFQFSVLPCAQALLFQTYESQEKHRVGYGLTVDKVCIELDPSRISWNMVLMKLAVHDEREQVRMEYSDLHMNDRD